MPFFIFVVNVTYVDAVRHTICKQSNRLRLLTNNFFTMKKLLAYSALGLMVLGITSPVLAQSTSTTTSSSSMLTCMQSAVEKRETSIISAVDTFHGSISKIHNVRKTALVDAWKIEDKVSRNEARKTAWTTYRTDAKSAHSTMKSSRQSAWSTFKTDRISCGAPITDTTAMDVVGTTL